MPGESNSSTAFLQGDYSKYGDGSIGEVAYCHYYCWVVISSSNRIASPNYRIAFNWYPITRKFVCPVGSNIDSTVTAYGSDGHGFTNYVDYSY